MRRYLCTNVLTIIDSLEEHHTDSGQLLNIRALCSQPTGMQQDVQENAGAQKENSLGVSAISLDQTTDLTAAKANHIPGKVALPANGHLA